MYNVKEGTGLGKCEGLVLGAFFPTHLVHTHFLCSEAFWNRLYDVMNINMGFSVVFQHVK